MGFQDAKTVPSNQLVSDAGSEKRHLSVVCWESENSYEMMRPARPALPKKGQCISLILRIVFSYQIGQFGATRSIAPRRR